MSPSARTRRGVPEASVARLPVYLRALVTLADAGVSTVSSDALAGAAGTTSAQLRKDLSHLGSWGRRGVGYDVEELTSRITQVLGVADRRSVVIVGTGHLGTALSGYSGFTSRGFRIAALVDADERLQGTTVHGMAVRPYSELGQIVVAEDVSIGVIAVPAEAAQEVCDALVAAGVTAIMSFAPHPLVVPADVDVRRVDLSTELQILSFHEQRKAVSRRAPRGPDERRELDGDVEDAAGGLGVSVDVPARGAGARS